MGDIELVIKISQESYNNLKIGCTQRVSDSEMIEALKNGTPLPKGHGRLIDESAITEVYAHKTEPKEVNGIQIYPRIEIIGTNAPTIIEADKPRKRGLNV